MKLSYRQATEMSGYPGYVVRGKILNKITCSYFGQPEVKAETYKAMALGLVYFVAVLLIQAALPSLPPIFPALGFVVALVFTGFLLPSGKGFLLYQASKFDEEFEL